MEAADTSDPGYEANVRPLLGVSTEQQGYYESSQLARGAKIQGKIWTLKSNNFYLTSPVWNTPPDHQSSWSTHACHQRAVVLPPPLQSVTQSDSWAVHSRRWVPTTTTILLSAATAKRHHSTLFIWYGPAGEIIHAVAYNGSYTLTWWPSSLPLWSTATRSYVLFDTKKVCYLWGVLRGDTTTGKCVLNRKQKHLNYSLLFILKVNYLIDEAAQTGKAANTIISMVHHFLQTHNMGEAHLQLHADNCSGQNKNR